MDLIEFKIQRNTTVLNLNYLLCFYCFSRNRRILLIFPLNSLLRCDRFDRYDAPDWRESIDALFRWRTSLVFASNCMKNFSSALSSSLKDTWMWIWGLLNERLWRFEMTERIVWPSLSFEESSGFNQSSLWGIFLCTKDERIGLNFENKLFTNCDASQSQCIPNKWWESFKTNKKFIPYLAWLSAKWLRTIRWGRKTWPTHSPSSIRGTLRTCLAYWVHFPRWLPFSVRDFNVIFQKKNQIKEKCWVCSKSSMG